MSSTTKATDPAFQGAGQKPGTEVWRIEDFVPVPLPKSDYGKFYSGDSYIVLQTSSGRGGAYLYDIHFWLGKDTSQDEAGTAAIKTVELDVALGGKAVQHRELQGFESDKFLSYFKPCIIPLEGGVASGFKTPEEDEFETKLYICHGKRAIKMKQVPFARSSLNHDDVFILDTKDKIYQFNGANSNIQERAKALEVVQFLKDQNHGGTCDVAIVDDGNLQAESDSGEFWVLFGGFAPIARKVVSEDEVIPEEIAAKLYSIEDGKAQALEGELSKGKLENNKCYLLDRGVEVFLWFGRVTQLEDRKAACHTAEDFITSQKRPKTTRVTRVIQGYETHSFKSHFDSWPAGSAAPSNEEGRGKVAAFLKQQGFGAKGTNKSAPVNEDVPPLLETSGKIEVWRINGSAKTPVPKEDVGKFYSGDCYIILYTYHSGEKKEDYYLCWWIGKDSIEDDQKMAARLANTMCNSLKGRPVLGRIFQGKEPPQFISIFQPMVVLKGGLSSGYKKFIEEKGLTDSTYPADGVALIEISETSLHNNKAMQVDAVEEIYNFTQDDLLTEDMMILDTHIEVFVWLGQSVDPKEKQSAFEIGQKYVQMAASLEGLSPHIPLYRITEGNEPCFFTTYFSWEPAKAIVQGNSFQKKVMLLFGAGHSAESPSRSNGGATQRAEALAALSSAFNPSSGEKSSSPNKSNGSNQGGATQRASALAALSSALNPSSESKPAAVPTPRPVNTGQGSQRAAALAALSSALTAEKTPDVSPPRSTRSPSPPATTLPAQEETESAPEVTEESQEATEEVQETGIVEPVPESNGEESVSKDDAEQEDSISGSTQSTFTYEQLRARSENPVTGIDFKRREAYLSEEEFQSIFGVTKEAFYKLPRWKQDMQKKKFDLF
uniref:HP domain-containing protein n=1 Tax=Chenopodium quinoa TaxID=63459 RepID=A0A803MAC6_CHEQI